MENATRILLVAMLLGMALLLFVVRTAADQTPPSAAPIQRCAVIELFLRFEDPDAKSVEDFYRNDLARRRGVELVVRDVADPKSRDRLRRLAQHFRVERPTTPATFAAGKLTFGFNEQAEKRRLDRLLTIEVFTRDGCPRCAAAKAFFAKVAPGYPGFRIETHEIIREPEARARFESLSREHRVLTPSLPGILVGGQLLIGYQSDAITGRQIDRILQSITVPCRKAAATGESKRQVTSGGGSTGGAQPAEPQETAESAEETLEIPLPQTRESSVDDAVEVPLLGVLRLSELGLPAFTFLLGLVDGFNPCAMWVLLFLLSILVNLQSRIRILAVAGTFVLISGLAYFAFMAAWLNVFLLIGLARPAQVALALLALLIGGLHVKDFFAFKQGVSLSIPESAKPGLYERVRKIVMAEYLAAAVAGAVVLAVLVNIVELLCTAGLPALYTQILSLQELPAWKNYAYLGLYNVAYMFDDSVMVGIVVTTLSRRRLQERGGRWLKLLSGLAVLTLGLVLLFKPDWLA